MSSNPAILMFQPGALEGRVSEIFIREGFLPQAIHDMTCIIGRLMREREPILFCDLGTDPGAMTGIISGIKNSVETRGTVIFIHTDPIEKEQVCKLIEIGVNGFILKPFVHENFLAEFRYFIQLSRLGHEKRRHVRFPIPQGEDARFVFRHPVTRLVVTGQMRTISVVSADVVLDGIVQPPLMEGLLVESLQINLGRIRFESRAEILRVSGTDVALGFRDIQAYRTGQICHYLFEKLNPNLPGTASASR
jgi:DNA-binding response OmpR family regulator